MSKRRYEVKAAMYAIVHDITSVQTALIAQESLELFVDVLNYRL